MKFAICVLLLLFCIPAFGTTINVTCDGCAAEDDTDFTTAQLLATYGAEMSVGDVLSIEDTSLSNVTVPGKFFYANWQKIAPHKFQVIKSGFAKIADNGGGGAGGSGGGGNSGGGNGYPDPPPSGGSDPTITVGAGSGGASGGGAGNCDKVLCVFKQN
jgi:hypothetical protein